MQRKTILNLAILLTSSLNYAAAILLNITWNVELIFYLSILLIVSFSMGIILVDYGRSLIYTCLSLLFSGAIVTAIMSMPPLIVGESSRIVDEAIMSALNAVSRMLIFNLVLCILAALMGSFLGDLLEPFEEVEVHAYR